MKVKTLWSWIVVYVVGVCVGLMMTGCANMGIMAKVQEADDALAARYGIPVAVVAKVRTTLGIPDARTIPAPDRVLPQPYVWYYDVLDKNEAIVDTTGFHYGVVPRIKQNDPKAAPVSVVVPAASVADPASMLEDMLKLISANPALLAPAK